MNTISGTKPHAGCSPPHKPHVDCSLVLSEILAAAAAQH